jgi:hypothetical protein
MWLIARLCSCSVPKTGQNGVLVVLWYNTIFISFLRTLLYKDPLKHPAVVEAYHEHVLMTALCERTGKFSTPEHDLLDRKTREECMCSV